MTFRTTVSNGRHVKDNDFRVTGEHNHETETIEYCSPGQSVEHGRKQPLNLCVRYNENRTAGGWPPSRIVPVNPATPGQFVRTPNIPLEFLRTLSGQKFCVRDLGKDKQRTIILTTLNNIELLNKSDFWLIDWTPHCTTDRAVKQLYTIHGNVDMGNGNRTCVPLVHGLLASRTGNACNNMFFEMKNFARRHGVNFGKKSNLNIVTDLQTAVFDMVNVVFPTAVHTIGLSHFSIHVYRRIQAEGLGPKFITDYNFNLLCRYLLAMAFLPVSKVRSSSQNRYPTFASNSPILDIIITLSVWLIFLLLFKIVEGFDRVKPLFSNYYREQNLLNYFESTFVTRNPYPNVHGQNPETIRPYFHPETWSVISYNGIHWSQVINTGESWRRSLNKYAYHKTFRYYRTRCLDINHPLLYVRRLLSKQTSLYDSILQLQHMQNEMEYVLRNGYIYRFPKRYEIIKYQREKCIMELVIKFKNDSQYDVLLFLKEIAYNLNFKNSFIQRK